MHWMDLDPAHARLAVGAMRAVAGADGEVAPDEARLVDAAARLLSVSPDVPPLTPETLRSAGLAPKDAERVVQAGILAALLDGRVDPAEVRAVRALAEAAGVDEPRVHNLAQLSKGHVRLAWLDLARRSFAKDVFVDALKRDGPRGVWKIVGPMLGRAVDPALAARYIALGELPEGTLGRAYFRFVYENGLGFPGEKGAVPESGVWHDVSHVLGGYGITPDQEVQVVSFIAGFSREDPFFWVFTITLQFHLGLRVSPYSQSGTGLVEPDKMLAAFARGAAMTEDLSAEGFDPWPLFPQPLEAVRAQLGVRQAPDLRGVRAPED